MAGPVDEGDLAAAVAEACFSLAAQMAGDAEGATKVVRVVVAGAASDDEAPPGARSVARSQLCKCSWYGEDPYWGRIASELGNAGIEFDPDRVAGRLRRHDRGRRRHHRRPRRRRRDGAHGRAPPRGHRRPRPRRRGGPSCSPTTSRHAYIDENMRTS